jgi:hypothetical protein
VAKGADIRGRNLRQNAAGHGASSLRPHALVAYRKLLCGG